MGSLRRRTRLFIARAFQIRYISLILAFMFVTAVITGYTVYYTTWIMFGEKLAAVYPQGLLLDIVKKVNTVLFLRLLFLTPLVILIGLVLSNRIAGPIYRIQKYLKKVNAGEYGEKLTLREKDELQDIAVSLNGLVAKLGADRKRRLEEIDAAIGALERVERDVSSGRCSAEDLSPRLKEAMEGLRRLRA